MFTGETVDARQLARDLPGALARGEIFPHFQPQVACGRGTIAALEGLARWRHPHYGLVPPDVFIPLAVNIAAIGGVTRAMIRTSFEYVSRQHQLGRVLDLAINVAPSQLLDSRFFDELDEELDISRLHAGSLILEITESEEIHDVSTASSRLESLRRRGVLISIDDFGAGFSSPERTLQLHADEIKIDRSLVSDVTKQKEIEGIVHFAHDHGIRVVGEGVETDAQWRHLCELGCDRVQGYAIGHPSSTDELDLILTRQQPAGGCSKA